MEDQRIEAMDRALLLTAAMQHQYRTPGRQSEFQAFAEGTALRVITGDGYSFRINGEYRRVFLESLVVLLDAGDEPTVSVFKLGWSSYLLAIWRRFSGFPEKQGNSKKPKWRGHRFTRRGMTIHFPDSF